jgi:hypothetical protein
MATESRPTKVRRGKPAQSTVTSSAEADNIMEKRKFVHAEQRVREAIAEGDFGEKNLPLAG